MARLKVGVQLQPQHTTVEALRGAWSMADEIGVDSIWVWSAAYASCRSGTERLSSGPGP
jgi:hypothetical protein